MEIKKEKASQWFRELRDKICAEYELVESEYATKSGGKAGKFERTAWDREKGGGGEMSIMEGQVFEKVGVNISTVFGEFDEKFRKEIPNAEENPTFWASGISLVAHSKNPLVPSAHFNTRMIVLGGDKKQWFGGGGDLTPTFEFDEDTADFHNEFKSACDKHNSEYYSKFKKWCDEYFFIKHRNEARGVGGIFYDYLNTGNWEEDFNFTQDVGMAFHIIYPKLVRRRMYSSYDESHKQKQLIKRGRYVEFNLVYDRGTRFGLMTDGNVDAILMSLPPLAAW